MTFNLVINLIYFSVISGTLFSTVVNAEVVAKLLISGILFSTAVNAELVANPLIFGTLPSISVILVLKSVLFDQIANIRNLFLYLIDFIFKI